MGVFNQSLLFGPAILGQNLEEQGEIVGYILIGIFFVGVLIWFITKLFKK